MLSLLLCSTYASSAPRFTVVNGCDTETLWIANQGYAQNHLEPQMKKLEPGMEFTWDIPNEGLPSTRFWPLTGCNSSGICKVGQSVGGISGLPDCGATGCAPAVDSKFEATWGCTLKNPKDCVTTKQGKNLQGPDYFDVSLVDGFTLPYRVDFNGCTPPRRKDGKRVPYFNASKLDYLRMCPQVDNLGSVGDEDLVLFSPRHNHGVVGCLSPCSRLTVPNWEHPQYNFSTSSDQAKYYCCPAGSLGPGQQTPTKCMHGPVNNTNYVSNIHHFAPDVYAYAYDDGLGGYHCPSNTTYKMTYYCPPKGIEPTLKPTPAPTPAPPLPPSGDLTVFVNDCTGLQFPSFFPIEPVMILNVSSSEGTKNFKTNYGYGRDPVFSQTFTAKVRPPVKIFIDVQNDGFEGGDIGRSATTVTLADLQKSPYSISMRLQNNNIRGNENSCKITLSWAPPPTLPPGCSVCTNTFCCNPNTSPPQKCLNGKACCSCGSDSCQC